jgi:phosphatidylserine/phosphatidylglycerophosphate/cardiolipin synthase-like enzyme
MQSSDWRTLGTANILGFLRADLKRASSRVWIIGPWIDAFFAQVVVDSLSVKTELRVITRPPSGANPSFREHAIAARACFRNRPNTTCKLLATLHAKLAIIDDHCFYCGSANWYRYSLEESREIVLRGPSGGIHALFDEIQVIWDDAELDPSREQPKRAERTANGYMQEVLDPAAEAKLKEVPGSFILRRPSQTRTKKFS